VEILHNFYVFVPVEFNVFLSNFINQFIRKFLDRAFHWLSVQKINDAYATLQASTSKVVEDIMEWLLPFYAETHGA
jgi:hypothetical protein